MSDAPPTGFKEVYTLDQERKFPQGVDVQPNHLGEAVRSCRKAARARNIAKHEELKSILFRTGKGYVMAHLRGDLMVDEEALSKIAGPVELVPAKELPNLGLEKGRMNPFTDKIYFKGHNLVHVVCPSVLDNEFVWTNDDTLTGSTKFRPEMLMHRLQPVELAPISKPRE